MSRHDTCVPEHPPAPGRAATVDPESGLSTEKILAPLASDPMGGTIHRLSNGMTVYVSTDHAGRCSTAVVVVPRNP